MEQPPNDAPTIVKALASKIQLESIEKQILVIEKTIRDDIRRIQIGVSLVKNDTKSIDTLNTKIDALSIQSIKQATVTETRIRSVVDHIEALKKTIDTISKEFRIIKDELRYLTNKKRQSLAKKKNKFWKMFFMKKSI